MKKTCVTHKRRTEHIFGFAGIPFGVCTLLLLQPTSVVAQQATPIQLPEELAKQDSALRQQATPQLASSSLPIEVPTEIPLTHFNHCFDVKTSKQDNQTLVVEVTGRAPAGVKRVFLLNQDGSTVQTQVKETRAYSLSIPTDDAKRAAQNLKLVWTDPEGTTITTPLNPQLTCKPPKLTFRLATETQSIGWVPGEFPNAPAQATPAPGVPVSVPDDSLANSAAVPSSPQTTPNRKPKKKPHGTKAAPTKSAAHAKNKKTIWLVHYYYDIPVSNPNSSPASSAPKPRESSSPVTSPTPEVTISENPTLVEANHPMPVTEEQSSPQTSTMNQVVNQ